MSQLRKYHDVIINDYYAMIFKNSELCQKWCSRLLSNGHMSSSELSCKKELGIENWNGPYSRAMEKYKFNKSEIRIKTYNDGSSTQAQ